MRKFMDESVFDDEYTDGEVFKYARTAQLVTGAVHDPSSSDYGFTLGNVSEVLHSSPGERDSSDWLAVVRLTDGSYGAVRANCDYTGWGCRESGDAARSADLDLLVRWWLSEDERLRLGLVLDKT